MTNEFKGRTGLDRIVRAAGYSWQGVRAAYTHEAAFRQETWLAAVMLPAAFWLGRDWMQTALLAATVVLVLVVELLNSAVEAVVDRVSFERHALSGRAKDYGSAAVLLALLLCGATWAAALWQRISQG
ncbi:MAG TPA: diacylglycerol kinase [Burkholderiaceae bacterium]|nr:diacylglycerol kinase [Burkholderiaceae bacterium]